MPSTRSDASCSRCSAPASPAPHWPAGRSAMRWPRRHGRASWPRCPAVRSAVPGAIVMDKPTRLADITSYNNFYEFGTDKADPAQNAHTLKTRPWTRRRRRRSEEAQGVRHRGTAQARPAGGAHLPPALRRGLVDGGAVDRLLAVRADPARRAHRQREVRRVRDPGRPASRCPACARACSTGPMSRGCAWTRRCTRSRCSPSASTARCWPNQNGAPVRMVVPWKYGFKSGKSHRQDPLRREAARHELGEGGAERVRLLFERQPGRRSPALEPGDRAPHRRGRPVRQEAPTLMFNGYEAQVGQMYAGMDLKKFY